jgi:hypothetical protein
MTSIKTLDWRQIPGGRRHSRDCYAVRGTDRWTVKRVSLGHVTFYVVRLNGEVVTRKEALREARRRAEELALDREIVR